MQSLPPFEWMERVIRIDSITHRSNAELVRFLTPLLREAGLTVTEQRVREAGKTFINLIACTHSPTARDLLVLNTHLDTVTGGDSALWTATGGDPLKLTRKGDSLYGLGSADVKLDFLCKLWALKQGRPWKRPVALVGTYGEERGLVGAAKLLASGKVRPRFAMVGEPSNLELIFAHKGHLIVTVSLPAPGAGCKPEHELRSAGRAAHSSTPHLGINAIDAALAEVRGRGGFVVRIDGGTDNNRIPESCTAQWTSTPDEKSRALFELQDRLAELGRALSRRKDRRFDPAAATLSINLVRTEKRRFVVTFDVRLLPGTDAAGLKRDIARIARAVGGRIDEMSHDVALEGSRGSALMRQATRALRAAGLPVVAKTKASSTEAALYHAAGAEAVVFGPGISVGNVHRPNERNSLRQLRAATRFYRELIEQEI